MIGDWICRFEMLRFTKVLVCGYVKFVAAPLQCAGTNFTNPCTKTLANPIPLHFRPCSTTYGALDENDKQAMFCLLEDNHVRAELVEKSNEMDFQESGMGNGIICFILSGTITLPSINSMQSMHSMAK